MKLINLPYALGCAVSGRTHEVDGELWIRVAEVRGSLRSAPIIESETLIKEHEDIGYERGRKDGFAEAMDEIVRCIKCKHLLPDEFDNYISAKWAGEETIVSGFCHKGERKEE